jgi:hypothetical protein
MRPPKRELMWAVHIEGQHNTHIGRRERNQINNVLTNALTDYLRRHDIPYTMAGVFASPSGEQIDEFGSTYSYTPFDWRTAYENEEPAEVINLFKNGA